MITPEQYKRLEPFIPVLKATKELGRPLNTNQCNQVADIYESEGWGHVNRGCSGCLTDMAHRACDLIQEYEQQKRLVDEAQRILKEQHERDNEIW